MKQEASSKKLTDYELLIAFEAFYRIAVMLLIVFGAVFFGMHLLFPQVFR